MYLMAIVIWTTPEADPGYLGQLGMQKPNGGAGT